MLDPSWFFKDFGEIDIDRPIFLLGPSGGGLTLISRMLRRNKKVVSVSGNSKYWAGADEMQLVLGPKLPSELTGIKHKAPYHPEFPTPRGWLFATDELIDEYRKTAEDFTPKIAKRFKKIIRYQIARNRIGESSVRFTDKSQVFSVKVSFINEILKDRKPYFVLIIRNPYAMCWRGAQTKGGMSHIKASFSFNERLELACQHWLNLNSYAIKDGNEIDNFKVFKFEEILTKPKEKIEEMSSFLNLKFDSDMIPGPEDEVPFGSKKRDRWYPLRVEVNKKYLEQVTPEQADLIENYCKGLAERYDYEKPTNK